MNIRSSFIKPTTYIFKSISGVQLVSTNRVHEAGKSKYMHKQEMIEKAMYPNDITTQLTTLMWDGVVIAMVICKMKVNV